MKKILTIALLCTAALVARAQTVTVVTNSPAQTYTNGITVRVPLSDQDYASLVYLRRATGMTNIPPSQVVTNFAAFTLTPQAKVMLFNRRMAIARKLQNATDAQLSAVEAALP